MPHCPSPCVCSTLFGEALDRYKKKIAVLGDVCPYELSRLDCSTEREKFPPVTLWHIGCYLVNVKSAYTRTEFNNFKSLISFKAFYCGWVKDARVKDFEKAAVVVGNVRHSMKVGKAAAKAWIIFQKDCCVENAHCNCEAGLGESCSHVGALLFFCEFEASASSPWSPTEVECAWNRPSSVREVNMSTIESIEFETPNAKFKRMRQTSFDSPKQETPCSRRVVPRPSREEKALLFQELKKISDRMDRPIPVVVLTEFVETTPHPSQLRYPTSLRHLFKEEYLQLTLEKLQDIAIDINLCVTPSQSSRLEQDTRSQSNCKLWFVMRAGRCNASIFKLVCHTNLQKPSISLLRSVCYPEKLKFVNEAMLWGCRHEETARKAYVELKRKEGHLAFSCSRSGYVVHPEHPHLGASPDGLVQCECCGSGLLEIKCPACVKDSVDNDDFQDKLKYLKKVSIGSFQTSLQKSHSYYYQIQCQLWVTKREYCDFFVWTSTPDIHHLERIYSDSSFMEEMVVRSSEYFHRIVLPELLGKIWTRAHRADSNIPQIKQVRPSPQQINVQGKPLIAPAKQVAVFGKQVVAPAKQLVPPPLKVNVQGTPLIAAPKQVALLRNQINASHEAVSTSYRTLPRTALSEIKKVMNLDKQVTVVKTCGFSIKSSDVQTLSDGELLNDEIMNVYLKLLEKRSKEGRYPAMYAFDCFFYLDLAMHGHAVTVQKWHFSENIFDYRFLVWPIHSGSRVNGHWSVVTVDTVSLEVQYHDSLGGKSIKDKCVSTIINFVTEQARFLGKDVKFLTAVTESKMPSQLNLEDYGVFVLLFAEHFSRCAVPVFHQGHIPYLRNCVLWDIIQQKIFFSSSDHRKRLSDKENIELQSPVPVKRPLMHRKILGNIQHCR